MPSREEIAQRVALVNSGHDGRVHPLDPAVTYLVLRHPLFRDRFRAIKFRDAMEKWPGYVRTYTRAGADLEFYRWMNFVDGFNLGRPDERLYTLAMPESNTVNLLVYRRNPSDLLIQAVKAVM